jgi:propanol-preferring alcohol dehydrogenase
VLQGQGRAGAMLFARDVEIPTPRENELLVRVEVCGVCRTDLDLVEGRLIAPNYPVIPGHQVVGRVAARGRDAQSFEEGDRVGVAWIHSACGICTWCRAGMENLCPSFSATGCDVQGGYAEYLTVRADFALPIPAEITDVDAAPLLCAGAVGWRALRLTNLRDGDSLGLTGFGASAHLVLQFARHRFPASPVYVFARNAGEREFARKLGAAWVGDTTDAPPDRPHAIIDTTPAWKPVLAALRSLAPGGRLVINAVRKERRDQPELAGLDYATQLWMEREIKSVANVTRADVRGCLAEAARLGIRPTVEEMPLARANEAMVWLRSGDAIRGARVLRVASAH